MPPDTEPRPAVIDALMAADAAGTMDYVARCLILTIVSLVVWAVTGLVAAAVWSAVFVMATVAYVILLRRLRAPVGRRQFLLVIGANYFIAAWYAGMPIYLASLGGPVFPVLALFGAVGLAFYNLTQHSTFNLVTLWALVLVTASLLVITWILAESVGHWDGMIAVGLAGLGVTGYYVQGHINVLRTGTRLAEIERDERACERSVAIGRLTTGIAHEFNNILTVIGGNLDLFEALDDPEEQRVVMEQARASSERATSLVAELLAISGKSTMTRTRVDLCGFLREVLRTSAPDLPGHITLTVIPPPVGSAVMADRCLLQAALGHGIDNARMALMDRGGTIAMGAETVHDADGRWVRIFVHDTGPGVNPAIMDRLAEPFFTTRNVGEGVGLGLASLKGFAEQSGGRLELGNLPGGGFGVAIVLPPAPEQHGAPDSVAT